MDLLKVSGIPHIYFPFSIFKKKTMINNKSKRYNSRSSYSTTNLPHPSPTFRTLLKRRNDTISASQLYETNPVHHHRSTSKLSQHSQISERSHHEESLILPREDIKKYVRQMLTKEGVANRRDTLKKSLAPIQDDKLSRKSHYSQSSHVSNEMNYSNEGKKQWSMEELERKIEEFLLITFDRYRHVKGVVGLKKWKDIHKTSQQKEIEDIIQYLKRMRAKAEEDDSLEDIDRKISLLERIIAGEAAESEVLKNQYLAWKNQRSNTTSFKNKQLLSTANKLNASDSRKVHPDKDKLNQHKRDKDLVVNFISSSKLCYSKPGRQFYLPPRQVDNSYSPNRQMLLKSSYSTQFFNYGYFPTYKYTAGGDRGIPQASLAVKASNYQQEYKDKYNMTKNVDFRELDCFRDKFKNTNISFMNTCKKEYIRGGMNHKNKVAWTNLKENINGLHERSKNMLQMSQSVTNFYKSEQKRQFKQRQSAHDGELLKSVIKNKKLQSLKESYLARLVSNSSCRLE